MFALAAFTLFVLADTCVKAVGASRLPAYQVIGSVGLVEVVFVCTYALLRGRPGALWPRHPGRQVLRSGLDLVNNLGVVIALRHLPLALFYILVFLAPAVTTVAEAFFLGEPLEWRRSLAVGMGFAGVVVAVNPFGAGGVGDRIGVMACMVCVACFATSMVWSRRLTQTETPESLTLFSGLVMTTAGALGMLVHAQPVTLRMAGLLAATGLFSVAGGLCFFLALKRASAATVSHFHYTQLLTGALVGYAIWRERPTLSMWAGAVLILASGWMAAAIARRAADPGPGPLAAGQAVPGS